MKRTLTLSLIAGLAVVLMQAQSTVQYAYDEAGRLVRVDYGERVSIRYSYDPAGNLLARTVSVSSAGLFFPFYQAGGDTFVGFAVSNFSDENVQLEFSARGETGGVLPFTRNPADFPLDSGKQLALLGSEIFEVDAATGQMGWVELTAEGSGLGSFFQFGNSSLTQLDGSTALSPSRRRLYFTRVFTGPAAFRGQSAATLLSIANPHDDPVTLRLRLFEAQAAPADRGEIPAQAGPISETTEFIAGRGSLFRSVAQLFERESVAGGYIDTEVIEGDGVVGFQLIRLPDQPTVIGLSAFSESSGSESYSAQLADGPTIFTNLKLVNVSNRRRSITLTAVAEDGGILAAPVSLALEPQASLEQDVGTLLNFGSAAPAEAAPATHSDQLFVGSLRVEADGPGVIGDVIFGDPDRVSYAASMPLQNRKFLRAVFSQVANALGFFTGIALYNPNPGTADVTIQVFSREGALTGEETITLEPGKRISRLVPELVPSTAGQVRGYIVIQSTRPLIAQQLFGDLNLNLLSAVPPTVIE